ncbi:DoxX family membrane protein [Halobium salinum]|uniref:DoxX family membrane protein n=1 Tax=Halobium salinum TaxID=1364940 RepID=A0ABD5PD26_9EURY|nr:DoxX family membrane protein [Halobium salinum]
MALEAPLASELLLLARLLFGGVLAFTGLNHFTNTDAMTGYAEAKGLPAPRLGVVGSGVLLVLGGLGLVFGVFPVLAAGALAVFLVVSALVFHDFWAVPEDQQQTEMTQFLKNVALAGAALALLALGGTQWAYALNVGVW